MMRFDNAVGNPPYQDDSRGNKNHRVPIYPEFMDLAYTIATRAVLITPARFLFNAGATRKAWNRKMLNDKRLRVVHYEQDSARVFGDTDIKGGVAITYRDEYTIGEAIGTFSPYPPLRRALSKVKRGVFTPISDIIHAHSTLHIARVAGDFPEDGRRLKRNPRIETNAFDTLNVFHKEKESDDMAVFGLSMRKRTYRYIKRHYISDTRRTDTYTVFLPKANGNGGLQCTIGKPVIGPPGVGHTKTFLSIGDFDTEGEACACMKYIKTKFARAMLSTLKVTQDNNKPTWKNVPIQDFTEQSDIDWTQTIHEIDQQLYAKYGLNDEEIAFIESKIKPMD